MEPDALLEVEDEDGAPAAAGYSDVAIHMLRTAQLQHLELSCMADRKASILVGSVGVMISVVFGASRGDTPPLPLAVLLLAGAMPAALFALLVLLPRYRKKNHHGVGQVNLLFFGSFVGISKTAYEEAIMDVCRDDEAVYRAMSQDIYEIGCLLGRKYRFLRASFVSMGIGITGAMVTGIVQWAMSS